MDKQWREMKRAFLTSGIYPYAAPVSLRDPRSRMRLMLNRQVGDRTGHSRVAALPRKRSAASWMRPLSWRHCHVVDGVSFFDAKEEVAGITVIGFLLW